MRTAPWDQAQRSAPPAWLRATLAGDARTSMSSLTWDLDQGDVGVLTDALEHNSLSVGRNIEPKERLARTKMCELSSLSRRDVEHPEILATESPKLDDDALAIGKKPVAVSQTV